MEFTKEEIRLFEMIAGSLCGCKEKTEGADPEAVYALAEGHGIQIIVYEPLMEALSDEDRKKELSAVLRSSTMNFYQLLRTAAQIQKSLYSEGVLSVLLKGAAVARLYPVPEARRSTDIDLLLADQKDLEKTREVLKNLGAIPQEKKPGDPNHHEEWGTKGNRLLELHLTVTEPFDDDRMNRRIEEIFALRSDRIREVKVSGIPVSVLPDDLMALHLLLHMWMDFLRAGFGLKLLCDWVVLWNKGMEEADRDRFLQWMRELGLSKFCSAVTGICVRYFGLPNEEDVLLLQKDGVEEETVDELLRDILETERNGAPGADRMVALRGNGFFDYVREFHHQTVLTFPKAAKLIFPLPVLYPVVFFRFLFHARSGENRRSVKGVMKSAASRGQLAKNLR